MQDEQAILRKAREAITSGRLPNRHPDRMLGGTGFGASCAVCAEPVTPDQAEFELEFAPASGDGTSTGNSDGHAQPQTHHVHIRCFAACEFERHGAPADAVQEPTMSLPTLNEDGKLSHHDVPTTFRRGSSS